MNLWVKLRKLFPRFVYNIYLRRGDRDIIHAQLEL